MSKNLGRAAELLTASEFPDSGPYISAVFSASEAELIYMEQEVGVGKDYPGIYWCMSSFRFGGWGAYAGIQASDGAVVGGIPYYNNNIFSVWGKDGVNPSLEYGVPGLFSDIFTGEGVGLHTSHAMPWRAGVRYAMAIRRWDRPGENQTRAAMFMYSFETGKWTHYSTLVIPEADVRFEGTSSAGFLERVVGDAARYEGVWGPHFRMNRDGSWQSPLHYEAAAGGERPWTWDAVGYGSANDGRVLVVCGGQNSNTENYKVIPVRPQADRPSVLTNKIAVMGLSARYENGVVYAEWVTDDSRTPQLSHLLNIRTGSATGAVVASNIDFYPQKRSTVFALQLSPGTYYASLVLTDIFNQESNYGYTSFVV